MVSRLPWRTWAITLVVLICLYSVIHYIKAQGYWLTYQVTPSVPMGWYWISPPKYPLHRQQIVVFKPPRATRRFLQSHHWLPDAGMMMKYVIGIPGDWVCNEDGRIKVGDRILGPIWQKAPNSSVSLPVHHFCRIIKAHNYLLMNPSVENSYDGRYFGPVSKSAIKGIAHPIWTHKINQAD